MEAVAVALSGGVDSSVAALLLAREGRAAAAGSFLTGRGNREGPERARRLCEHLGLRHYLVEVAAGFQAAVVAPFVESYRLGVTPNPCVRCNPLVKFGLFARELECRMRADGLMPAGADFRFATGHYARIVRSGGRLLLARPRHEAKDQTYMLYRLSQQQLAQALFPLGETTKEEVRAVARREGLEAASAAESQDACFLEGPYVELLRAELGSGSHLEPGEIRDLAGNLLGRHRGYAAYTVGQRHGLGLGSGPWYVTAIDARGNLVVVARRQEVERRSFEARELNWLQEEPRRGFACTVQLRYRSGEVCCRVEPEGPAVRVLLQQPQVVTPGQSAVFYDGGLVLGGGVIEG